MGALGRSLSVLSAACSSGCILKFLFDLVFTTLLGIEIIPLSTSIPDIFRSLISMNVSLMSSFVRTPA